MDDGADCNAEGKDWVYNIDLASPSLACKDPGMKQPFACVDII